MNLALFKLLQSCTVVEHMLDLVDHICIRTCRILFNVVLLVSKVRQILHVWLQLFKQNQAQSHKSLLINISQVISLLYSIDVKEDVILFLKDGRVLLNKRFNELREQQDDLTVAIANVDHLL